MGNLKLTSSKGNNKRTSVHVDGVTIGEDFVVIAGPCSVESEEQMVTTAQKVKAAGANLLRGGAFKPRTSPYSFQGWGEKGLKYLAGVRERTGMLVVTELMDPRYTVLLCKYADVIQIGRVQIADPFDITIGAGFEMELASGRVAREPILNSSTPP